MQGPSESRETCHNKCTRPGTSTWIISLCQQLTNLSDQSKCINFCVLCCKPKISPTQHAEAMDNFPTRKDHGSCKFPDGPQAGPTSVELQPFRNSTPSQQRKHVGTGGHQEWRKNPVPCSLGIRLNLPHVPHLCLFFDTSSSSP